MDIPEAQFETWSHAAPTTMAKGTHESIRKALKKYEWPEGFNGYDVYLQGSYKNNTRIRSSRSDVDVVVQLCKTFKHNVSELSDAQQKLFNSKTQDAPYDWDAFRADVISALENHFDPSNVVKSNKCIKLKGTSNRIPADIVVCVGYRKYGQVKPILETDIYDEGIAFRTSDGTWIINYPNLHYENGKSKMKDTNEMYKSMIRIYKNINKKLIDDGVISTNLTTSYFIECLLYNVPNANYRTGIQHCFLSTLVWLMTKENLEKASNFKCQNGITNLFGSSSTQWNTSDMTEFLTKISNLWSNW